MPALWPFTSFAAVAQKRSRSEADMPKISEYAR
jgi:hypothetical protein